MTVYGRVGLRELAKQNLAKAAYAADHFGREAKVLFAELPDSTSSSCRQRKIIRNQQPLAGTQNRRRVSL